MKTVLFIDTSSNVYTTVRLTIGKKEYSHTKNYDEKRSQIVLPMIKNLLSEHKLKLNDITEIEVNDGPGSFTGLRVGVAIANALSYFLNIPINDKPSGTLVEPRYT